MKAGKECWRPSQAVGYSDFFCAVAEGVAIRGAWLFRIQKRKTKQWPVLAALLTGGGLVLAVSWALGERQPRYLMGAFVFLVPLVAWMVSLTTGWSRRTFEVLLTVCILTGSQSFFRSSSWTSGRGLSMRDSSHARCSMAISGHARSPAARIEGRQSR